MVRNVTCVVQPGNRPVDPSHCEQVPGNRRVLLFNSVLITFSGGRGFDGEGGRCYGHLHLLLCQVLIFPNFRKNKQFQILEDPIRGPPSGAGNLSKKTLACQYLYPYYQRLKPASFTKWWSTSINDCPSNQLSPRLHRLQLVSMDLLLQVSRPCRLQYHLHS